MRKAFLQALLLVALFALPVAVLFFRTKGGDMYDYGPPTPPTSEDSLASTPEDAPPVPTDAEEAVTDRPWYDLFSAWESQLSGTGSRLSPPQRLQAWREAMAALPRDEALAGLGAYLESERDVATGMPFAPGEGGELAGAPTLRTAVLDLLGLWDPASAHALAAEALEESKGSAAEYALHLRNYAWGAPEAMPDGAVRTYLGRKARELVSHPSWQRDPSSGYQEAFDVLVWAGAVEAVPLLTSLLASHDPNLVQPAGLTLDRLVLASPEEALRRLREEGESLDERPQAIAGYFARADPGHPAERALVEGYFLADERTAATRDYFLLLFPNVNLRLSHNLLSENEMFSHDLVLERHREALAMLQSWSRDERFDPWQAEIERAIGRLDEALR